MLLLISAALADSLTPAVLPADGDHHASVSVDAFGRYAIVAESTEGVAIQLIDRMAGPMTRSGLAGARDGRLDTFLSRGDYRVATTGAPGATGEVHLALRRFEELNAEPLHLTDARTVSSTLGDFQQRSYWMRLTERERVDLEAAGRYLADFRLWREGAWLVDAAPRCATVTPSVGQPLTDCTLSITLEPGLYRVTAYGGEGLAWMRDDGTDPLIVRRGIPDLGSVGQLQTAVSAVGIDRWRVSASWVEVALPEPEAVQLSIRDASDDPFRTGGTTRQITLRSAVPVASAALRGGGERIVTVRGSAGQPYRLQHFTPASSPVRLTPSDAPVWLSTIHSGRVGDTLDATGMLLRRDRDGLGVTATAPVRLTEGVRFERRFNLTAPASVLLEVSAVGRWSVAAAGVDARLQLSPVVLDGSEAAEPVSFRGGEDLTLSPGLYQLTITPDEAGILALSVRPTAATGQPIPVAANLQFPAITLDKAGQHSLVFEQQGGARVGVIQRPLPLALAEPLPLRLGPSESLTVPVDVGEAGLLTARSEQAVSMWVDGWEADAAGVSIEPGERQVRLVNRTEEVALVTLRHTPARMTGGLAGIDLSAMPEFPALTAEAPLAFDLLSGQSTTVGVSVAAPALYVLESTGLLAMGGTLRTQTMPRLDEGVANGAGRNFRIEQYLREGDYQLTATTQGRSAGHLGLRLTEATLHDGGRITPGMDARMALEAGEGVVYRLQIDEAGEYTVAAAREGATPRCRLETADGWPLRTPGGAADFTHRFPAGEYRLVVLPGDTAGRLVTTLRPPQTTPRREGHGPHPLTLDAPALATWMEPRADGTASPERVPDTWTFSLAAPTRARVVLSAEMSGTLWRGEAAIIALKPGEPWSGDLDAGEYRMTVRAARRNHGIPYTLTVSTEALTAGRSRDCTAPCRIPLSVAGSGLVELTSTGSADVRARLLDAEGTLLARSDDRPGGWNFQILTRLAPGPYQLQIDPVGASSAPVTVAFRQPDEPSVSPMIPPGQLSVTPGADAVLVPVAATIEGVLVVRAAAAESVGLAVEWLDGATWRVLGEATGRDPALAVPAVPQRSHRLRVWAPDHRGGAVDVALEVVRPDRSGERALARGITLDDRGGAGVAAVRIAAPGVFQVPEPVTLCATPGTPCREIVGTVALPAGELVLVGAPGQSVVAERSALTPGDWRRLSVRNEQAVWTLPRSRGATLVIARANAGQPGLSLSDAPAAITPRAAAAVSLSDDAPTLRLWSGISGERLIARVRAWRFTLPRAEVLGWGVADLTAEGGEAGRWALPGEPGALRLSLQAGAVAAVQDADGAVHVRHADGEAVEALLWGAFTEVVLLNPTDGPLAARMELLASHAAAPVLTTASPIERHDSRAAHLQIAVPEARPGHTLQLRGAVEGAVWRSDGGAVAVLDGESLPITGSGVLDLRTGPGTVVAWIDGDGEDGLWSLQQAVGATPIQPPVSVPLSGAFQGHTITADAGRLLHVHLDIPAILSLRPERGAAQTRLLPAGGTVTAPVAAGQTTVLVRAIGEGALSGTLTARLDAPTPIGEGLGPSVVLAAGEERWFSVTVPEDATVGAGVRADSDRVSARLLSPDGAVVAEGAVMMADLPAGTYLMSLSLPADAAPARARPVIAGLTPPDTGPPDAVVRRYLEAP